MQVTKANPWRMAALSALVLTSACSEDGAWRNPALAQQAEGLGVETGIFAADMQVDLVNDGPVTILFDTAAKD